MAPSSFQASFRRTLLSRLLLLSVPVLILGVFVTSQVTYRKSRSALLDTARQNLTASAVRKGQTLQQTVVLLEANLASLSSSYWLTAAETPPDRERLQHLQGQLSGPITCLQLRSPTTQAVVSSSCDTPLPQLPQREPWPQAVTQPISATAVQVDLLPPTPETPDAAATSAGSRNLDATSRLELSFRVPVYDAAGQLRYSLQAQASLLDDTRSVPGSLAGYPVIIDETGTILAHPFPERVGRNIAAEADSRRLKSLLRNALAGQDNFLHLFSFDADGGELLAGYTSIPSPLSDAGEQRWVILAIARLEDALADIESIRRVLLGLLVVLTLALLAASILATLYISRETARPLEQLRDYALNKDNLHSQAAIPHNFRIHEFNQLGLAFEAMLNRLHRWTAELEEAWRDAKVANQLKDEFLTITSHELRTPLNGILGSLQIVQDDLCDSRAEELAYLQQAHQSALTLYNIVNDISDITKLQAGQLKVSIEAADLVACLQAAVKTYEEDFAAKGLALHWRPPPGPIWVYADAPQLQRVFVIVLDNALKFTAQGSVTLSTAVQATPATASGQWAVVSIQDTGLGVAPELQAKLFKPFAVVDGSRTRQHGGIGLGLAIARNLMDLMQGCIDLTSDGPNCGTTVTIGLPVARQVAQPTPPIAQPR